MANAQKDVRVLVNRKGKQISTTRSDKDAFNELERRVEEGNAGTFAADLISKGTRYGLSDEQFWWVHSLLEPVDHAEIPCGEITARMHDALLNGVKMRNMKCNLLTEGGQPIRLSMAGSRSKYHGDVWVTDDGEYPSNRLFGRIEQSTGIFKGHNVPEDVQILLIAIQENPEAYLPW